MSTLKIQESDPKDEFTQLRKQAAEKDNRYATLQNELFKKNSDLSAVKGMLNETVSKLRSEADRILKLESDLHHREEDLRAERLTRQNLEASLTTARAKLISEEQTTRHLQTELDNVTSNSSTRQELELKRLQSEKSTLEARIRVFEAQSPTNSSLQQPTRLPRSRTSSESASGVIDARIASLESALSKAKCELGDTSRSLSAARQEAAKIPRLQTELIAAENARMRAEKVAQTEKAAAENVQELLQEREEELAYWRNAAGERSTDVGGLEDAVRERDDAIKSETDARRREAAMRKRLEVLEQREANLVIEREAHTELQLQTELLADLRPADSDVEGLRAALAERDSALVELRGHSAELQQMYRDALSACEDAESRVQELERRLEPATHDAPPLVIISPPPLTDSAPFLAQPKPMTMMSHEDEAVVARLLSAIERLRSERDALRRDLHFVKVEHRIADEMLQARLRATESEVRRLEELVQVNDITDHESAGSANEERRVNHELNVERTDAMSAASATGLANINEEIYTKPSHELGDRKKLLASYHISSRIAISSLIVVQHLRSELDQAVASRHDLTETYHQVLESRNELLRTHDEADSRLTEAVVTEKMLRAELAASNARVADFVKDVEQRDIQIGDMRATLAELQIHISSLQCELSETHEELRSVEARHSAQQLDALSTADKSAAEALKSQLEVLEQRILRRTEQIGMLQHDGKRLETNLRVAEDTIGDLTSELETLGQERACLLEDCAQAREARDEAHRKVDALEAEMERHLKDRLDSEGLMKALENAQSEAENSTTSLERIVPVIAEFATRSRAMSEALVQTRSQLVTAEANLDLAENRHLGALGAVERLSSQVDSMALTIRTQTADTDALTRDLALAREENQQKLLAFERLRNEARTREQEIIGQAQNLTLTVEELKGRLTAAHASKDRLSRELEGTKSNEMDLQLRLEQAQAESQLASKETQQLSSAIASLEQALEQERNSHVEAVIQAEENFKNEASALEAKVKVSSEQLISCQGEHGKVVEALTSRLREMESRLSEAHQEATSCESLESDLRRLKSEHADELLALRSRMDEFIGQAESLQAQLHIAKETNASLESEIEASVQRHDASQVEIRSLERAVAHARTQADEHNTLVRALRNEKTTLQFEKTRLEAELDKLSTRHQYVEQQAKRSDHEVIGLKSELERLSAEVAKFDEAAQTAEVHLSFKTNQFDQKLAMMQRELQKQQSHRQCQESIAELNEKNEYLEEMLRMKSVEIEENDDRFIDALKEKKRLASKVESLTRKVQSLQAKVTAIAVPSTALPPLPISRPKTPSPPILPRMPSAASSTRPPTRIPSSPAVALRARTPEPSRRVFVSKMSTPEPALPPMSNILHKSSETPLTPRQASCIGRYPPAEAAPRTSYLTSSTSLESGSKKRPAPDDFDSPAPLPAQAIVVPSGNVTPRRIRRPTSDGRSGFTPTRISVATSHRPPSQPSPPTQSTAPLAESTNSPRRGRQIGLGKPASFSKPPMRSWLSRTRTPIMNGDAGGLGLA